MVFDRVTQETREDLGYESQEGARLNSVSRPKKETQIARAGRVVAQARPGGEVESGRGPLSAVQRRCAVSDDKVSAI